MKKILLILLCGLALQLQAQDPIETRELFADSIRLKRQTTDLDSLLGYGSLWDKLDSIRYMDQNGVSYNLLAWLDSLDALGNTYLKRNGTTPLTANWDAGAFKITADYLDLVTTNPILHMDASASAILQLDRGSANRNSELQYQTAGTTGWYSGLVDSDIGLDGSQFFIGQNNGGTAAHIVLTTSGFTGFGTSPTDFLDIYKSANSETTVMIRNPNTGGLAASYLRVSSGTGDTGLAVAAMGTNFTTAGGFVQDGGIICAESDLSGGLSIMTRASAPIRFYVAGYNTEVARFTEGGKFNVNNTANTTYQAYINGSIYGTSVTTPVLKLVTSTPGTVGQFWQKSNDDGTGQWADVTGNYYKGTVDGDDGVPSWSATPLIDGTGTEGWYAACSDAGTYDYGNPSGNSITLAVGDQLIYQGAVWNKIPGAGSYTLPTAEAGVLGGIKVGGSLDIAAGVLNIDDQDFGPITVTDNGETWTLDNSAVTYNKIQNVSDQWLILGRKSAGAGIMEEISMSGIGKVLGDTSPVVVDSLLIPLRSYDAVTFQNSKRSVSEDSFRDKIETVTAGGVLPTGTEGQTIYSNAGVWTATSLFNIDDVNTRFGFGVTPAVIGHFFGATPILRVEASGASQEAAIHLDAHDNTGNAGLYFSRASDVAANYAAIKWSGGTSGDLCFIVDGVERFRTYASGTTTFFGDVGLGASSLSLTGSIASTGSRVLKGWFTDLEVTNTPTINGTSMASIFAGIAQTFYLGTTQIAINRASAAQSLTGITSIDGSAASLKSPATTGLMSVTGMGAGTTRAKTVRDADDTILELGGSYTPTGTWNWGTATVTWPTFNQNTTGSAAKLTTARAIYGNDFDGSAALTQIIASTYGGTGNGFTKFTGPATSEKTFTLPNANATLARTDAGQTFTGVNTMVDSLLVPDVTYNSATYNNSNGAVGRNAFRDKMEAVTASKFIVQGTSNSHLSGAQFLGSLASGIVTNTTTSGILSVIPNSSANWDAGYNDKINSVGFATATGILTLNQQDSGMVTVDLDGRYLTTSSAYQPLFPNVVNDITLANQYNKVFSKPAQEFEIVTGPERPHASLIVDDYYFVLDREYPALLMRFDPDDLASGASTVTFPTATPYGAPEQMIYLPSKGMIYIYFARAGSIAIVEVNPSTMAYSTVIAYNTPSAAGAGPMVSDGTYLYFTSNAGAGYAYADSLYQYRLSDWVQTAKIKVTGSATDYPHAMAYDGNSLFITTTSFDVASLNKVYKVDLPAFTLSVTSLPIYSTMSDDMVVTGSKLYIGKEDSDGHIMVIDKSGSPFTKDSIYTGISAPCYGVFFDGNQIWATMGSTPGGLARINPQTREVAYMYFGTGYDLANEIAFHGGRMFITFYQPDFGIGRICLPDMISVAHGALTNPMTTSQDMIVGGASGVPTRLAKGADGSILGITAGTVGWVAGGGSMVYPGAGIPISTGIAWAASITNNSANWNTAYSWGNHASAGYALTTGKLSQFASTSSAELAGVLSDETGTGLSVFATSPTFTTGISLASTGIASFNTDDLQLYGNGEGFISSKENNVAIGVKDGGGDFEYVMKANYNAGNSAFEANYNGTKKIETTSNGFKVGSGADITRFAASTGTPDWTSDTEVPTNKAVATKVSTEISAYMGAAQIYSQKVQLSAAQVDALSTTPVKLIDAPGSTKMIFVLSVVGILDYNSDAYDGGGKLQVYTHTAEGMVYESNNDFYKRADDVAQPFIAVVPSGSDKLYLDNEQIYITASSDISGGNSPINIHITYLIWNLLF
jgi:hypothetical protein